jgi:hypothetical protein
LAKDIPLNCVPDGWLRADEARQLVVDHLRTAASWAWHRRSQAIDADIVQLLDAVCAGLEAQVRAREDVVLADAAGDRLNTKAAVRAERRRRSLRLR